MELALKISTHINTNSRKDDLLQGCIAGKRAYQKQLYELYYGKMMAICMRYTNNYEEARDVLHEGFVKVFKNLHRYKPSHSLESWIRRIMINTSIDHYRKNKKHRHQVDLDYASTKADKNTVDVIHKMSADEIMKLVQQLTPAYRTVFNLYVVEGYNHREIGELLGISEGTSKSNLAKARGKLKKMIKEQLEY